jgi:hypothetical protein
LLIRNLFYLTPDDVDVSFQHIVFETSEGDGHCHGRLYTEAGKRVLTGSLGFERDEVTRGWRQLYNEGLCTLYSSPNIIRMIKQRRMIGQGL